MKGTVAGRFAAIIMFLSLFSTCGDLGTMFPLNGSYQVKTLVNGVAIEDCSIIRSNAKIRPFFASSVANDPDLIGLLVYLQDAQGNIIGEKVQYTLEPYADGTAIPETEVSEDTEPDEESDPLSEETENSEETEISEETDGHETEESEELPEYEVKEQWSFTETKPVVKNADIEIAVKSLARELPYFPLPKNLEIGPYTLVFEALGKKEILSRMETKIFYLDNAEFDLKDISMYLPEPSGSQLISPGTMVMLEAKLDFDSRLDPYVIWYNGKNIISEGKIRDGAGNILWKAPEQAGFYSLRLETFPFRLGRSNYTGLSREITLPVSPKAVSLGYFFENNLGYTARSPLAAGTAYPEQLKLIMGNPGNTETEEEVITIPPPPPELLQWYQFNGNLHNATSALADKQTLLPASEAPSRWAAAGNSYGLSIGTDNPYVLAPVNFFRIEQDQGGGILLFHIKPSTESSIFSAFFPSQSSATDGVWMDMARVKNAIVLYLSAGGTTVEMPVYLAALETAGLIPIAVEFYIRPYRMEAKLSLGENMQNQVGEITLPGALSGVGVIRLGGSLENSRLNNAMPESFAIPGLAEPTPDAAESQAEFPSEEILFEMPFEMTEETDTDIPAATEIVTSSTIWDELAILFSAIPLVQEEQPAPADIEADAVITAVEAEGETPIPAVQHEAAIQPADNKPVDKSEEPKPVTAETPMPETLAENGSAGADDEETGEDEHSISPVADTDMDDSIEEPEKLAVLPENS